MTTTPELPTRTRAQLKRRSSLYAGVAFFYDAIAERLVQSLQGLRLNPKSVVALLGVDGSTRKLLHDQPSRKLHLAQHFFEQHKLRVQNVDIYQLAEPVQAQSVTRFIENFFKKKRDNAPIHAHVWRAMPPTDIIYGNMIWSHYTAHHKDKLLAQFKHCYERLDANGLLFFSHITQHSAPELHALWPCHALDMHDLGDILLAAGFNDPVVHAQTFKLPYTAAQAPLLLKDLQAMGFFAQDIGDNTSELKKSLYARYVNFLQEVLQKNGFIQVEVAFCHAWKLPKTTDDVADKPIVFHRRGND